MRSLIIIVAILLLNSVTSSVYCQNIDSIMKIYSDNFPQEKIHIHFDKFAYADSDNIWFKAYLLSGTEPSTISTNLYIDWIDEDGKILKHTISPIIGSTAKGQFEIPSKYKGHNLIVKAYTQWMLNFDQAFIYTKNIPIAQKGSLSKETFSHKTTLQFFPEGGDLVIGISSKLAFKAIDEFGLPIEIKGVIKNNNGETIDSFYSQHDGMGSLLFEAKNNESYSAYWSDASGKMSVTSIPLAKTNGIILEVHPAIEKELIVVKRKNNATEDLKSLHLIGIMNQHVVFNTGVNLANKTNFTSNISTASLPTGILQITILDAHWLPVSERIVFINNHEFEFKTNINITKKDVGKKGKNLLDIYVDDSIASNLSVAITDLNVTEKPNYSNSIITNFLLCSELRGYIYNPSYYFSGDDDEVDANLDLVMLTHGWRRYNWENIIKSKFPILKFPKDSNFLSLKGQIINASNQKIPSDQKLMLITQSKNGNQAVFNETVSPDGTFSQESFSFFDTLKVFYQFINNNLLTANAEIKLSTNILKPQIIPLNNDIGQIVLDSIDLNNLFLFQNGMNKKVLLSNNNTLPEVTVKGKTKTKLDLLDEEYTSATFRGDGLKFDMVNDQKNAANSENIFHFLESRLPIRVVLDQFGNPTSISWRMAPVDIFLDEISIDPSELKSVSLNNIGYVKVFQPGTSVASNQRHGGGSPGGVIALYSKTKDILTKANNTNTGKEIILEGYTPYKEFYSPDYSEEINTHITDKRATLYWNPTILTNSNNKHYKIEFHNNDFSSKLKVIVEGINIEGKICRTEKIIE